MLSPAPKVLHQFMLLPTMGASAALIRAPWSAVIIGIRIPRKRASCTPLVMYCQRYAASVVR